MPVQKKARYILSSSSLLILIHDLPAHDADHSIQVRFFQRNNQFVVFDFW